jgi:hypothetical protein
MTLLIRLICVLLFFTAYPTLAYYFYCLDERHNRDQRWTVERAESAIAAKCGPGAEVSLQQVGDNEFIGSLKVQNDRNYKLGFRNGITYKLKVRVVDNQLEYEGESDVGAWTGGGIGPPQYSFWKAHPSLARYVYGAAFCFLVFGAIYPALAVIGWRRRYSRSRERLLWVCGFINLCFAVLEGYCFVALPS